MSWGSLPDWLNLIVLAGLAIITWWYARSTREMTQVMQATYEMQATPQLAVYLGKVEQKDISSSWQKLAFELSLVNAGNYLLTVDRVTLIYEVPTEYRGATPLRLAEPIEALVTTDPTLPLDLIPSPEVRRPLRCETNITKDAQNLRFRIEYKDFRGHSYHREISSRHVILLPRS